MFRPYMAAKRVEPLNPEVANAWQSADPQRSHQGMLALAIRLDIEHEPSCSDWSILQLALSTCQTNLHSKF